MKPRDMLPAVVVEQFKREFAEAFERGEIDCPPCAVCGAPTLGPKECLDIIGTVAEAEEQADSLEEIVRRLCAGDVSIEVRAAFRLGVCVGCYEASAVS